MFFEILGSVVEIIHLLAKFLSLLQDYSTGDYSYRDVADRLNARGFRTVKGGPFREASVRDVLGNRFYDGKVVYHEGKDDELTTEGIHEVPQELKDLWTKSQSIKRSRRNTTGYGVFTPAFELAWRPISGIVGL